MESVGQRIKKHRQARGLRVNDLAEQINVAPSTLRDWEYGRAIKGEPYAKLAEALGVGVHYLLTGEVSTKSELNKAVELLERAVDIIRKHEQSIK